MFKKIIKVFLILLFFSLFFNVLFINKSYAGTQIVFKNTNPTFWQFRAWYYDRFDRLQRPPIARYMEDGAAGSRFYAWTWNSNPSSGDYIHWLTACVDPNTNVNVNSTFIAPGIIYFVTSIDVSCKQIDNQAYRGCGSQGDNQYYGYVDADAKCPAPSNYCVWGGRYYGLCTDYCGGDTPANNCERINRNCTSSGCDVVSRRTYAAVCNDPDGSNDGGNRCAPAPPSGRTETAFCQGPGGTDRAAGIQFNWDRIPLSLERDSNPYDIQYRQVGGGDFHEINGIDATSYRVPGSGCTSGPGGCSLPYDTAYEWRIQAHTENGIAGPTDWSSWRTQRTNDCSGKPDLRITGFTFPDGNSGGTSDATVTIINSGYKGTGTGFNIRVNNGSGTSATVSTGALAQGGSRTVTVPNIARPNAGSHTATATVDSGGDIDETDETNNTKDDPYNTTSNIGGSIFIDNNPTNGTRNAGENLYTPSINIRVGGVNYTTTAGTYNSGELGAGTYSVSMPSIPPGYIVTTGNNPTSVVLGPNRTVDFGIVQNLYSISGNVYNDNDNSGTKNAGDTNHSGLTVTLTGCGGGNTTTTATDITPNVNYQLLNKTTGTCTVSIPATVTGYTVPVTSQSVTIGPDRTGVNFRLIPRSTLNIHVYNDYNGNAVQDCVNPFAAYPACPGSSAEIDSNGRPVTVSGGGAGTYTTNANGDIQLTNLLPGSSTARVTLPSGWALTTPPNPKTVSYPPSPVTINFGIRPPGPTCTALSVNPTTAVNYSGQTRTLTATCTNPSGGVLTYNWSAETGTVPVSSATNSVTWTATAGTMNGDLNETVATQACDSLTGLCSASIQASIPIVPFYSISGNVFEDVNKNGKKIVDNDSNYSEAITITRNPANGSIAYPTAGEYRISDLPAGNYTIAYTSLPSGYESIYPPLNSFNVTLGTGCNTNDGRVPPEATCVNGNIFNLNYAIIYGSPWIQSQGSDIWFNNGLTNPIPSGASCQTYASLSGPGGTPGIVYSGIGNADLGEGQASANPYNWKVGGISQYSESYGPASLGSPLVTSYSYIKNLTTTNGTPPTTLTAAHCGAGGIASCTLSPALSSGVYEAVGNLTLANNYAFPGGRNYVILVTGNLRLSGTIDVPVGSTVLFSVQGNIYVDPSVGTATVTSTTPHLEGWFSTDQSFYVEGGSTCPTRDNRLNVEGAIIVNASLQGGSFYNQRDLCSQNSNCPVFYVKERPDFILNSPRFIKNAPRVYKEVAP